VELGKLRREGHELNEIYYHPLFVYMGDTHIDVFKKNPFIFNYPTIIVECTFLGDDPELKQRAERDGHIIW
jgi:ribonuclease Z